MSDLTYQWPEVVERLGTELAQAKIELAIAQSTIAQMQRDRAEEPYQMPQDIEEMFGDTD